MSTILFHFANVKRNAAFAAGLAFSSPVASVVTVPPSVARKTSYTSVEIHAAFNRLAREIAKVETHTADDDRWYVENIVARQHDAEVARCVCPTCLDAEARQEALDQWADEMEAEELARNAEEENRHPLYESQGLTWN